MAFFDALEENEGQTPRIRARQGLFKKDPLAQEIIVWLENWNPTELKDCWTAKQLAEWETAYLMGENCANCTCNRKFIPKIHKEPRYFSPGAPGFTAT